jgi:hypothetical protein
MLWQYNFVVLPVCASAGVFCIASGYFIVWMADGIRNKL